MTFYYFKVYWPGCREGILKILSKVFDIIKSAKVTADSRIDVFLIFHNISLQYDAKNLWNDVIKNEKIKTSFH